jgi:hypothetical protein
MKATGIMKTTGTITSGTAMIVIITTATTGSRRQVNDRGLTHHQAPVEMPSKPLYKMLPLRPYPPLQNIKQPLNYSALN